jgi:cell division septation protein DedD
LSYAEALEAGNPSKTPPPPVPDETPAVAPSKAEPPKMDAAEKAPAENVASAEPPPTPKMAAKSGAALDGWVVQIGAFNANDVAAREAAKLQGKGYPAFVFTEPPTKAGPHYKVRVGPYSNRSDAERMVPTLTNEGYKPFLTR